MLSVQRCRRAHRRVEGKWSTRKIAPRLLSGVVKDSVLVSLIHFLSAGQSGRLGKRHHHSRRIVAVGPFRLALRTPRAGHADARRSLARARARRSYRPRLPCRLYHSVSGPVEVPLHELGQCKQSQLAAPPSAGHAERHDCTAAHLLVGHKLEKAVRAEYGEQRRALLQLGPHLLHACGGERALLPGQQVACRARSTRASHTTRRGAHRSERATAGGHAALPRHTSGSVFSSTTITSPSCSVSSPSALPAAAVSAHALSLRGAAQRAGA
jgi:hypothetical protein